MSSHCFLLNPQINRWRLRALLPRTMGRASGLGLELWNRGFSQRRHVFVRAAAHVERSNYS